MFNCYSSLNKKKMFGKEIGNVSIKVNEARDRATALKALGESLHDVGEVSRMI